jgi:hypothetical protein
VVEIADRSRTASALLTKVGAVPVWRRGGAFEDFITERLLLEKTSGDRSKSNEEARKLAEKYSLDWNETEYLREYLAIEEMLRKRKEGAAADKTAARHYYEDNKKDYLLNKENRTVSYLVMKYQRGEKLGSVALVFRPSV